jgi:CheY-like chemotaxis protein
MRALRVLLVEDSPEDAVLLVRSLARGPFQVQHTRVQDAAALKAALAEQRFDIVLCDFELPSLDAFEALAVVRGHDEALPLIVVSGRIGEDVAVETVRRGANDYLLKSNLTRLPVAVERALDEAEQKRERAAVREQLVVAERMATGGTGQGGAGAGLLLPLGPSGRPSWVDVVHQILIVTTLSVSFTRGFGQLLARRSERSQELEQLRAKLGRAHEALERMVAARSLELERATRDLDHLVASMSHDLKAPLRHVRSFIQLYQDGAVVPEPERTLLSQADEAAAAMVARVENIVEREQALASTARRP